jgi:hypothetical protein
MGVGAGMSFQGGSLANSKFKITSNGGMVVGTEVNNLVTNGNHKAQIIADNNNGNTPLVVSGGDAAIELWKNSSISKGASIGMNVPGYTATDDIYICTYNGAIWTNRILVNNSDGYVGIGTNKPMGRLSISDGPFAQDGDSQVISLTVKRVTQDNSSSVLYINNIDKKMVLPDNTVWNFSINISCISDTYYSASFNFRGCVKRASGSVSFVGSYLEENFIDSELEGITAEPVVNTIDNSLDITIQGLNDLEIRWTAGVKLVQTSYSDSEYFVPMKLNLIP